MFIHMLDDIPKNWYTQLEMHRETVDWECLTKRFITTFSFQDEDVMIETTLQMIKEKVFEGVEESKDCLLDWVLFAKKALESYKIEEAKQEDDEPREVHVQ